MRLKRIVSLGLATVMSLSMAACGRASYDKHLQKNIDTYEQYVTLGEYKNLEVEVDEKLLKVSDDDVKKRIESLSSKYATTEDIKTGVTKEGDVIVLDYSGAINGEKFSGGTATDANYTVGSKQFIEDLDKGLHDLEIGKTYEIPVKFPDNYSSSDLKGKDAVFTVTVKKIVKTIYPTINDELVAKIAKDQSWEDVKTVADMNKKVKEDLEATAKANYDAAKENAVWEKVIENAHVTGYDNDELAQLQQTIQDNVKAEFEEYGSYYSVSSLQDWVTKMLGFESTDAYNKYVVEYSESYLKEKMIVTMIAAKEGLTVSSDEIDEAGEKLAESYQYDSFKAMYNEFGDDIIYEIGEEQLWLKVNDVVMKDVTAVPLKEKETETKK